jgi:hypothetical protein
MAVTNGNHATEANGAAQGQPLDLTVLGMNSGTSMVIKHSQWKLVPHMIKGLICA